MQAQNDLTAMRRAAAELGDDAVLAVIRRVNARRTAVLELSVPLVAAFAEQARCNGSAESRKACHDFNNEVMKAYAEMSLGERQARRDMAIFLAGEHAWRYRDAVIWAAEDLGVLNPALAIT